jgi:hypothetical protein
MSILRTTLSIVPELDREIVLQYIPSSISLSEETRHNTVETLAGKTSFISPKGTETRTITVDCYWTALIPAAQQDQIAGLLGAQAISLGLGVANFGGSRVTDAIDKARQTINLAAGVFNLVTRNGYA